ncbi:peptidase domain-containing ABC transporter [Telmatospirillum sp. J64-1]|uniref:peptidase domain-containing ABC transporter n=1 Tax=Telmatospirillum sp. J64-1 TaxID=2502183 RepID=UPI00115F1DF0|nr:ATP-binding cassette domain-containing protein [Telmatospirillum sp. J64-1]
MSTVAQTAPALSWSTPRQAEVLSQEHLLSGSLGGFKAVTDLAACLLPLLAALDWEGDTRRVAETLPHFVDQLDVTDFLNVMAGLGYTSRSLKLRLDHMDPRLAPCLFVPDEGAAKVIVRHDGETLHVFDPDRQDYVDIPATKARGLVYVFQPNTEKPQAQTETGPFVGSVIRRFRPLILRALAVTLIANILVLATPLFIMGVYDKVVATGSQITLLFMLAGIAIALIGDFALKALRARMIAYLGARLDHILGTAIFQRLIGLAPPYTEMANISSQVARLKDFEVIREFFTGSLATVVFELPFATIFLIVMAILAGPIVLVPIAAILLYVAVGLVILSFVRKAVNAAGQAASRRQEFLVEALSKMTDIKGASAEGAWAERFRALSAEAALASHRSAQMTALSSAVAQGIVIFAGLITLAWGVLSALDGTMTVGALMASMILVWWVLRPLQTGFSTLSQIERMRSSITQINRLMQVKPERPESPSSQPPQTYKGKVVLNQVSMRYVAESDPAVAGVSITAEPGEVIAVVGPNGSGKSTILKLILGMYRPQAGSIRLDDVDIRQVDPIDLRSAVAYVPQHCEVFFGTIAQNLRLAKPTASDEELRWACNEAGCLDEILALPQGFETRIGDGRTRRLPSNLLQRLSLARAYLKRAPVTLFDEPANGLDFIGDQQFMKVLERMKGHSTVFLVTHRPSHLRLADKIVVMVQGQVRMMGPAKQVLERLPPSLF